MSARRTRGGGEGPGGAHPLPVVNGLDTLGVGMEYDLDAAAAAGGLRREVLNQALDDSTGLKKGADWEVAGGRIRMTPEALEMLLAGIGHRIETETLEAAKTAAQDSFWNRPGWRRMRVTNPWASRQLVLGYLMDTGEGCSCVVPNGSVFAIGMHVAIKKAALASAPELYELAEKPPRGKGRW
jgi:hypothetical protein